MNPYCPFFETLHDETKPVGHLGRGTHYSVLRAVVFQDAEGNSLKEGHFHDFAVIWDEDHDDRVMEPIYKLYCAGLLSSFLVFGERKGMLAALIPEKLSKNKIYRGFLCEQLQKACTDMVHGDWWSTAIGEMASPAGIINAHDHEIALYLSNINMLWGLGIKTIKHPPSVEAQEAEREQFFAQLSAK